MKALEERILKDGKVLPGHILQVGAFLNQQIDTDLILEMGREIARLYEGTPITKILTIEASGIAIAFAAAACLHSLGVTPGTVPDQIEDPWERVEWICRPSGTKYRRVKLEEKWYKRSFGVMMGVLDSGETVPLLQRPLFHRLQGPPPAG